MKTSSKAKGVHKRLDERIQVLSKRSGLTPQQVFIFAASLGLYHIDALDRVALSRKVVPSQREG
jgi:hypothetical protein